MDGADVRVVQRGGGPRFGAEPVNGLRILRQVIGDELERNRAAKTQVFGGVHDTHTARAEVAHEPIMRNRASYHVQGVTKLRLKPTSEDPSL